MEVVVHTSNPALGAGMHCIVRSCQRRGKKENAREEVEPFKKGLGKGRETNKTVSSWEYMVKIYHTHVSKCLNQAHVISF